MDDNQNVKVVPFEDACDCISDLLSIEDKLIYFAVSATMGKSIVPLIHNHRCIESIYVWRNFEDDRPTDWTKNYSKIRYYEFEIDQLAIMMKKDIDSIMQRPSHWSRSKSFLAELCSQSAKSSIPVEIDSSTDDVFSTLRIVTLYFDAGRPFRLSHSHGQIRIEEYNNIEQFVHSTETSQPITVFVLIAINHLTDIRLIAELDPVQALYIVPNVESFEQMHTLLAQSKVSGIFSPNEDLLEQLTSDICFYRRIRVCTPVKFFKMEPDIKKKLTVDQSNALRFTLFSGILSQLPQQWTTTNFNNVMKLDLQLSDVIAANAKIIHFFEQLNQSTLQASIPHMSEINQYIMQCAKVVNLNSGVVYRAQLVSQKDWDIIKSNPNTLIAMQGFILASRSLSSVAKLCRRAVDNQLTVILLELKLPNTSCIATMDTDTVVFRLGTVFRLICSSEAADGVYHAQLELANGVIEHITNKLRVEIGSRLNWLTLGIYLVALEQFSAAEEYYRYLQSIIPEDDPIMSSVYNNMGLMYAAINNNQEALGCFQKALQLNVTDALVFQKHTPLPLEESPPGDSNINKITILDKIGEISAHQGDYTTAINAFCQLLEITEDPELQQCYQNKIDNLSCFDHSH